MPDPQGLGHVISTGMGQRIAYCTTYVQNYVYGMCALGSAAGNLAVQMNAPGAGIFFPFH